MFFDAVYDDVDKARAIVAKAIYKLDKTANVVGPMLTVSNVNGPGTREVEYRAFAEEIHSKLEEISERLTAVSLWLDEKAVRS
jgi:capsid protein